MVYELTCNTVQMLVTGYFNNKLPLEVRDAIITHITKCKECEKMYRELGRAYGFNFNVDEEIKKILDEYDKRDEEKEGKSKGKKKVKESVHKWFNAAKKKDIATVMAVKAVRDFMISEGRNVQDEQDILDTAEYGWYVIKKICKKVDKLENLYKLSGGTKETDA